MAERKVPDELDLRILRVLARDARASFRAIARELGISTPTVAQRVKRMEQAGVIRGYHVETAIDQGRAARPKPDWACGHCKGPILGSAYTRSLGGKTYAFCCSVCRDEFTERYRDLSRRAEGSKKPLHGLLPWFALASAGMLGMLGTCPAPGQMVQTHVSSCVGCLPPSGTAAFQWQVGSVGRAATMLRLDGGVTRDVVARHRIPVRLAAATYRSHLRPWMRGFRPSNRDHAARGLATLSAALVPNSPHRPRS